MTRRTGRIQPCDRTQARTRLDNAHKSLEVAELAAAEQEIPASRSVAAALAVLSGIAATDAACCDRAERFHGDRSQPRRGASLTSRRRIGSIEKAPLPGLFP